MTLITLNSVKYTIWMFLLFILIFNIKTPFASEKVKFSSKNSIRETYNDNINFATQNELDDFITSYVSSVVLTRDTQKSRMILDGSAEVKDYLEENSLDEVNQYYTLTYSNHLSPLFTFNTETSFVLDTTLVNEPEESGLSIVPSERQTFRFQPGATWRKSQVNSFSSHFGYGNTLYESEIYPDNTNYEAFLSWSHALSEKGTSSVLSGSYNFTEYEVSQVETYSLFSGFNYPFDPGWELDFWVGIRQTASEFEPIFSGGELTREKNWGHIGYLHLKHSLQRGSAFFEVSRNVTSFIRGETVERDLAQVGLNYHFTELTTGRLRAAWSASQSEGSLSNIHEEGYSLYYSISHRLRERTTAELLLRHDEWKNRNNDTRADRNIIFVQINVFWEKL